MAEGADVVQRWSSVQAALQSRDDSLVRIGHELRFVEAFLQAQPADIANGRALWEAAIAELAQGLAAGTKSTELAIKVEKILSPFAAAAKAYTVHCIGHAHIDMNWMWPWPETVDICHDTFTTVNRLMDEFPAFRFSQSQASTYLAMEQHSPEIFAAIKRRIAAGQWEVTANLWVEGDKNLAAGEALCRQILLAKRYLRERLGLGYEQTLLAFEPDTFGHTATIPQILRRAGIRYYYFCRAGREHQLFWWEAPDGSRVLAWNDSKLWYLGPVKPENAVEVLRHAQATGMKDYLLVYGVGDHGGGPTRRDLRLIEEMNDWPIWPAYRFSTFAAYFALAEQAADRLPVVRGELNYVFRGCYSSQSNIKRANRFAENMLVRAESLAAAAHALGWTPYPRAALAAGWRNTAFNQFHDILPGSGVKATYEYAQGLFQETRTLSGMAWKHAAEQLAARLPGATDGQERAVVVFNPQPWPRTEGTQARVFDMPRSTKAVTLTAASGTPVDAQVVGAGAYWGHEYVDVAWTATAIPGLGYSAYRVKAAGPGADLLGAGVEPRWLGNRDDPAPWPAGARAWAAPDGRMQNEFYRLQIEPQSGCVISLIDRRNGAELVPPGVRLGLLQVLYEAPHGMSAWEIGPITRTVELAAGGRMRVVESGPVRAVIRCEHMLNDSKLAVDVVLHAGVARVDFRLQISWLETGNAQKDAPMLKMAFPLALTSTSAQFEAAFGAVTRPAAGAEVPTQQWMALSGRTASGSPYTAAILNDSKYGCDINGATMRMTLLRSSYEPDPYPELGNHEIRLSFASQPGEVQVGELIRWGQAFNNPLQALAVYAEGAPQTGALAAAKVAAAEQLAATGGFLSIEPAAVGYAALKLAEESDDLVLRLFETEGVETTARIALHLPVAEAREASTLEEATEQRYSVQDGTLTVPLQPYELKTLLLRR